MILDGEVGRLVLTHKDRLLRFGAELDHHRIFRTSLWQP